MNDYERQARANLTDTSVTPLTFPQLLALEPDALNDLSMDYGWIFGLPQLRGEILSLYEDQRDETLFLTHGALHANQTAMDLILEPGDHVIAFTPGYQQFYDYPALKGCSYTLYELPEMDWKADISEIEKLVLPNTKMILFANPSNPTGTYLEEAELKELVSFCKKRDIWILCDEVYRSPLESAPAISDLYEKGISTGSLSKLYGLSGLRMGWLKGPKALIDKANVFKDYTWISSGPLKEQLAWVALKHKDKLLKKAKSTMDENKAVIEKWLQTSKRFECILPQHGPVCFLKVKGVSDTRKLALDLLHDTGIFFVPGECFLKPGYFRLGLGQKEVDLEHTLNQLEDYVNHWIEKQSS